MVATQQYALLCALKGTEDTKLPDVTNPAQCAMIKAQLGACLRNKQCLLLLDDVCNISVLESFNFEQFAGALIVTGPREAWCSAPSEFKVEVTRHPMTAPWVGKDGGAARSHAERVLASTAQSDVRKTTIPPECMVSGVSNKLSQCKGSLD